MWEIPDDGRREERRARVLEALTDLWLRGQREVCRI
jgi:hypothetical protein